MLRRAAPLLTLTLLLFAVAPATRARADWWPLQSAMGDHTGWLLRTAVGFGAEYLTANPSDTRYSLAGPGPLWDVAVGYSIAPRFALHVSYFGGRALSPSFERKGHDLKEGQHPELSLNGVGVGGTYYFPSNIYLSLSSGLGLVEAMELSSLRRKALPGFAAGVTSGWEWWISRQWGIGVALHMSYFHAKDPDVAGKPAWNGFAAGPLFTATFN